MEHVSFVIRVAVLGHVSARKSTVVNALLQGKFSQVGMRRTTEGVNSFRIHTPMQVHEPPPSTTTDESDKSTLYQGFLKVEQPSAAAVDSMPWHPGHTVEKLSTAKDTLEKITRDNTKIRAATTTPNDVLHESVFDVELDELLCEMRPDTRLVLTEVPGLNQAGSEAVYRDYVLSHWNSLDCVIVVMDDCQGVMDVCQGVNTEEQVQLLKLIQQQNSI